jgi:hypothetical protein
MASMLCWEVTVIVLNTVLGNNHFQKEEKWPPSLPTAAAKGRTQGLETADANDGHANVTVEELGPEKPRWYYYRLIGCGETGPNGSCDDGSSEYRFHELPLFCLSPNHLCILSDRKSKKTFTAALV